MSRSASHHIDDLEIRSESNSTRVLLSLTGKLTIDSSPDFRDQLLEVLSDVALEQVTVDLQGVSYIDLSGIATFIEALKFARAGKTGLILTGLQDRPRYLLEVSGLLPLIEAPGDAKQDATLKGSE